MGYAREMKVLFFSPHAGILEHALPERSLMKGLSTRGWQVTTVGCRGLFDRHCNVMAARGLMPGAKVSDREIVCDQCTSSAQRMYPVDDESRFIDASSWLRPGDLEDGEHGFKQIDSLSWADWEEDGVPVGRMAGFEFMLTFKLDTYRIPDHRWADFQSFFMNVFLARRIATRALEQEDPDRVVVYNSLYGVNRVWKVAAERRGIRVYSIHAGYSPSRRLDSLMMYHDDNELKLVGTSLSVSQQLQQPLTPRQVAAASRSVIAQIKAKTIFVYSMAHESLPVSKIREILGLSPERQTLLVPLSSHDERFAGGLLDLESMHREPHVFASQDQWIDHLFGLAEAHPEWQVVIRLHPRMFPNRREGVASPTSSRIMDRLSRGPDNVVANTPNDQLSISDILQVTDVGLVGTSSAGLQMLALGLPVVVHDPHLLYAFPPSIAWCVEDADDYELAIERALRQGWSLDNVRKAFRWYSFRDSVLARSVDWHPLTSDGESDARFTSTWSDRKVRTRDGLAMRLPMRFKLRLGGRRRSGQLSDVLNYQPHSWDFIDPFEQVLQQTLPGLQSVLLEAPADVSEDDETAALHSALRDIATVLGQADQGPDSLTSRILLNLNSVNGGRY